MKKSIVRIISAVLILAALVAPIASVTAVSDERAMFTALAEMLGANQPGGKLRKANTGDYKDIKALRDRIREGAATPEEKTADNNGKADLTAMKEKLKDQQVSESIVGGREKYREVSDRLLRDKADFTVADALNNGKAVAKSAGLTSAANYDKVRSYIQTYGEVNDDGDMELSDYFADDELALSYAIINQSSGIYFETMILVSDYPSELLVSVGYTLTKNSKYITVDCLEGFFYYDEVADAVGDTITVDRSTYNEGKTLYSYQNGQGGIIDSSSFTEMINTCMNDLCAFWDEDFYDYLGFGLKGLGFLAYAGKGNKVCDIPSGYHVGTTVVGGQCNVCGDVEEPEEPEEPDVPDVPVNPPVTDGMPVLAYVSTGRVVIEYKAGYQYSKDGKTWQKSHVFDGLKSSTKYSFYQKSSDGEVTGPLQVTTLERVDCPLKPVAPIVTGATNNSVTVLARDGYEYKLGNGSWQDSNTFTGLTAGTSYTVYQRIKQTEMEKASSNSKGVSVKTTKSGGTTSATNYDKVRSYIQNYGENNDDGYKEIVYSYSEDNFVILWSITNQSDGIYFEIIDFTVEYPSDLLVSVGYSLKKNSKYIDVECLIGYSYYEELADIASDTISVDRSTYHTGKTLNTYAEGLTGIIDNSSFRSLINSCMQSLCGFWDEDFYDYLGFGLKGLGFTSFDGYGNKCCDAPSGYHSGSTEVRFAREGGCAVQGYTGDTYCTGCGEKTKTGSTTAAKYANHTYDNDCDRTCNNCSLGRYTDHLYSYACDMHCDHCDLVRIPLHIHTYDNEDDASCNICGEVRELGHDWSGHCDVECDTCGQIRDPEAEHTWGEDGNCSECGANGRLLGDVTGDGKVNMGDVAKVYAHVKGTSLLTDPIVLKAADATGDGKINMGDVGKIYAHVKGTALLW